MLLLRTCQGSIIHGELHSGVSEFSGLLRSMPVLENLQMYAMEGVEQISEESIELVPNLDLDRCKLGHSLRKISEADG